MYLTVAIFHVPLSHETVYFTVLPWGFLLGAKFPRKLFFPFAVVSAGD